VASRQLKPAVNVATIPNVNAMIRCRFKSSPPNRLLARMVPDGLGPRRLRCVTAYVPVATSVATGGRMLGGEMPSALWHNCPKCTPRGRWAGHTRWVGTWELATARRLRGKRPQTCDSPHAEHTQCNMHTCAAHRPWVRRSRVRSRHRCRTKPAALGSSARWLAFGWTWAPWPWCPGSFSPRSTGSRPGRGRRQRWRWRRPAGDRRG
jgi:hypothetical protein